LSVLDKLSKKVKEMKSRSQVQVTLKLLVMAGRLYFSLCCN